LLAILNWLLLVAATQQNQPKNWLSCLSGIRCRKLSRQKKLCSIPTWSLSVAATQQHQPEKIGCFADVA
jgi:hypothetical protein